MRCAVGMSRRTKTLQLIEHFIPLAKLLSELQIGVTSMFIKNVTNSVINKKI